MRKTSTRWAWGLALILLGVGLLLNSLNLPGAHGYLAMWWPMLLVVIAIGEFLCDDLMSGAFWLIIGGVLLLFTTRYISYSGNIWQIIWPIVLILVGLRFLVRPARRSKIESHGCDWAGPSATFGETVEKETSQDFKGTSVRAVFGGTKLDLSGARIAQEGAVIDLTVKFGGVELVVPKGTPVRSEIAPVLGGLSDKRSGGAIDQSLPAITIRGEVVFGGVEIKD